MHISIAANEINMANSTYLGLCSDESWSRTVEGNSRMKLTITKIHSRASYTKIKIRNASVSFKVLKLYKSTFLLLLSHLLGPAIPPALCINITIRFNSYYSLMGSNHGDGIIILLDLLSTFSWLK